MVRRWSYINSVNVLYSPKFETHKQAAFGSTVRATMYFRRGYTVPTALTRSRWARRKHLNGWLVMSNVIKVWSQVYRFNRNHLKSTMRQHFSTSTFIAFNVITVKNSIPCLHKGSESIVVSPLTKKILRYFSKFANPRVRFLLSLKNVNLSVVSVPQNVEDFTEYLENSYSTILFTDDIRQVSGMPQSPTIHKALSAQAFSSILSFHHLIALKTAKSIYRTLTLLTLSQLHNRQ